MTRRRVLLLGSAAVVAALALAVWVVWPRPVINAEHAAKIKNGMTLAQVEAILGGPARDETTGPVERIEPPDFAPPDARGISWRIAIVDMRTGVQRWQSDQSRVWVHFDDNGVVTDCQVFPLRRKVEGALAVLHRWIRL